MGYTVGTDPSPQGGLPAALYNGQYYVRVADSGDVEIRGLSGGYLYLYNARLRIPNGTLALPSFTFDSDVDLGLYRIGANNLGVSCGGTKVLDLKATYVESSVDHRLDKGNALISKLTKTNITTAGAATWTAAQMLGGLITRDPAGAARTDTTDTAANIVGAVPGAKVGDVIMLVVVNTADAAEVLTIAGGSGVTMVPSSVTPTQNEMAVLFIRLDNVTAASEAVTIYALAYGA